MSPPGDERRFDVLGAGGVIPEKVWPPMQVALGVIELGPERGFAIHVLGHDPRSTGYVVGIDCLTLRRKKPWAGSTLAFEGHDAGHHTYRRFVPRAGDVPVQIAPPPAEK